MSLRHRTVEVIRRRVLGRPAYEAEYWKCWFRYQRLRLEGRLSRPEFDVAFVLPSFARGWILEAICHEIRRRYAGTSVFVDDLDVIPPARAYFFAHYGFLAPVLRSTPHVWAVPRVAFFTHPRNPDLGGPETIFALNRATKIVSMCSLFTTYLVGLGVRRQVVTTSLVGADPRLFQAHVRGQGRVGFCTAYYERKNPGRIIDIVRLMPHRKFTLLGRNWREYPRFGELDSLPNFQYHEAPYADYPAFYSGLDVFVSPAQVEGGPIPLLEAMMSNALPVASRTGFAPDIIRHGDNGFLFDVDAPSEQIAELIDKAFNSKTDVRATVVHLTWERFVGDVARYFP